MKAQRGSRGQLYFFFNFGVRWERVISAKTQPLYSRERDPLSRRLDGTHGWSGHVRKISPWLGFDSRAVQPVAGGYAAYAFLAVCVVINMKSESLRKRFVSAFGNPSPSLEVDTVMNSFIIRIRIIQSDPCWVWIDVKPYENTVVNCASLIYCLC